MLYGSQTLNYVWHLQKYYHLFQMFNTFVSKTSVVDSVYVDVFRTVFIKIITSNGNHTTIQTNKWDIIIINLDIPSDQII